MKRMNKGPVSLATVVTSSWDNFPGKIPAAILVQRDIANTSIPNEEATRHSGTVLIPNAPTPNFLPLETSTGVS